MAQTADPGPLDLTTFSDRELIDVARAVARDLETSMNVLRADGSSGRAPGIIPGALRELANRVENRPPGIEM